MKCVQIFSDLSIGYLLFKLWHHFIPLASIKNVNKNSIFVIHCFFRNKKTIPYVLRLSSQNAILHSYSYLDISNGIKADGCFFERHAE